MTGATIEKAAQLAGRTSGDSTVAYALAFSHAVEAALNIAVPSRAQYLRALMAELERLANHFGDIGAICNDASFTLMHAHCGILRERILRAADACFGHRLMMDRIVPGGVARNIAADGGIHVKETLAEIRRRLPRLIELYDNTASLQDRTVNTGVVSGELVRQFGAGGYVGRASGRAFDARKAQSYPPYDQLEFEVPVLTAGDVNARVWVRIREVEQKFRSGGPDIGAPAGRRHRGSRHRLGRSVGGLGSPKDSAATCSPGCGSTACAWCAATCATRHGFSGRCWKPRSRTTSSPTFRCATNLSTARIRDTTSEATTCAEILLEGLARGALTEPPPSADDTALAELAAKVDRAARRRLGRSLSIRQVDAGSCNGCELEIHALNNAFYDLERFGLRFVASPRHADVLMVTGPVTKNMREALQRTYNATPDPKSVVAVGDCALDGGLFAGSYAVAGGVSSVVPVDLHIRGCPPRPVELLKGLLALLEWQSAG